MPEITNPQVVKFVNEQARVWSESMVAAYQEAKSVAAYWAVNGLASVTTNVAADVVQDGAAQDGRSIVTGQNLYRIIAANTAVITWFEQIPAGDTVSRIDRFRSLAVNPRARF